MKRLVSPRIDRSSPFAAAASRLRTLVVPTAMMIVGNWIKLEIAVARGKQLHDKRETLRRRTLDREAEQAVKDRDG